MIDYGDMLLRLNTLVSAMHCMLSINSISDVAPLFLFRCMSIDRVSNRASELMKEKLHDVTQNAVLHIPKHHGELD